MFDRKIRSEKRIKEDAKKIRRETTISHFEALNLAVQAIGYSNYHVYQEALKKEGNSSLVSVRQLRNELVKRAIDYAIFIPTQTGLKKSIFDATAAVRDLFESEGFHDYQVQQQGTEYKVRTSAFFINRSNKKETIVSLYRPNTKKGDPRMWFKGMKDFASANDCIAIVFYEQQPYLLNLSRVDGLDSFLQFINQVAKRPNVIAEELLTKLKSIAKGQPLSSTVSGDTAIGMAVEQALGIPPNSSKAPDYNGIEIKSSRRKLASTRNTLFAQVADWSCSHLKSSREILDKYGYQKNDEFRLYCTVSALKSNPQGLSFSFKCDDEEVHEIHENDGGVAVWSARLLKKRLQEKHAETFWVKAEAKKVNGKELFYLKSVIHTRSPLNSQIIPLLKEGVITMDHLIKRNTKGRVSEKGPLFKISPSNLDLLFPSPIEYDLLN